MKHVDVHTFKEVVAAERGNETVDFINVCTPAEYKEEHIEGVRSLPLDQIEAHVDEFKGKKTIYVHCRSGNRGRRAIEKLQSLGVTAGLVNVEGGIMAWRQAGFAVNTNTSRLPVMRQVLIAAGGLALIGYVLSVFVAPHFVYLSVLVAVGLLFAGLTGWCGMSFALAKMPWNK